MSNYTFNIDLACKFGVEEAIILENIIFWINKNAANEKHFYDGKFWTYNSVKAFKILFPFWTSKQISRILKSLIAQGILITGNFNSSKYLRTLWYSISDKFSYLLGNSIYPNGKMENTEKENGNSQKVKSISDNKPNIKLNIKPEDNELFLQKSLKTSTVKNLLSGNKIKKNRHCKYEINQDFLNLLNDIKNIVPFKTRLPSDFHDSESATVVYKKIQQFISDFIKNNLKGYVFDKKWMKDNKIIFDKFDKYKESDEIPFETFKNLLIKSVTRYKEMWKEGYWPYEKKYLTLDLYGFLYNIKTQKSWFLYCLFNKPKEIKNEMTKKIIGKLPEEFKKWDVPPGIDENEFFYRLNSIYRWYNENKDGLERLNNPGVFVANMGNFSDFMDFIFEFKDDVWKKKWNKSNWSVKNWGTDNKTWNLFINWVYTDKGINLKIN